MNFLFTSHLFLLGLFSLTIQVFYISFGFSTVDTYLKIFEPKVPQNHKTILFYAYFDKNHLYLSRLKFFLDIAVKSTDPIDYIFIIQGNKPNVTFPNYQNIQIIERQNDCYDFGAYGDAINRIGGIEQIKKYKAVMFINPSASGPILPKYWPKSIHWSSVFTSKLKNGIHAVSTSISCPPNDFRGYGPGLESFAIAATPLAIELALNEGVFSCKKDMNDAIVTGEYLFSSTLLKNQLNLDSFLLKYEHGVDWRNRLNWNCNENKHPTGNETYNYDENDLRITVYPLEVMFHKVYWTIGNYFVYYNETLVYLEWAQNRASQKNEAITFTSLFV
jgi:hypothetical protein